MRKILSFKRYRHHCRFGKKWMCKNPAVDAAFLIMFKNDTQQSENGNICSHHMSQFGWPVVCVWVATGWHTAVLQFAAGRHLHDGHCWIVFCRGHYQIGVKTEERPNAQRDRGVSLNTYLPPRLCDPWYGRLQDPLLSVSLPPRGEILSTGEKFRVTCLSHAIWVSRP